MNVLILGRGGQVALELAAALWPAGLVPVIAGRPEFDMARPETLEPVLERAGAGVVINATAYTAVDKAETEASLAFAINRDGPARLAELCHHRGVPVLHISTDYVFDGTKAGPYGEDDPVAPLGVYGASKEAGEAAVRALAPRHVILRTSWVYSVHGQNFVKTMLRLGAERDELRVVADQHGAPTAAADIAAALVRIAAAGVQTAVAGVQAAVAGTGQELPWGTYHYTGEGVTTWHGLAEHIFAAQQRASGRRPRLVPIPSADYPTPARRPANSRLECSRIGHAFGIAGRPWREGVDEVLARLLPGSRRP